MGLVDRAFLLSHPRFHEKNLKLIVSILLYNDYSLEFIFSTINERLRCLFLEQIKKQNLDNSDEIKKSWFTIPYFPSISDRFNNNLKNSDII